MTACLSRFELARRDAAGELENVHGHVRGCARCTAMIAELAAARRELLGDDPVGASARAARNILAEVAERKAQSRWSWRFLLPIGLAPVAATLALVLGTGGLEGTRGDESPAPSAFSTSRAKGALVLEVFCKRGEEVFQVNEGADFYAGDRLRFAYTKPAAGYLTVFGVDDRGTVFPYYQDAMLLGMFAQAGAKQFLPGSVELDDHRGWERLFAVWSETQLPERHVRDAVTAAFQAADGDVRKATKLALPEGAEQVTYLLHRP